MNYQSIYRNNNNWKLRRLKPPSEYHRKDRPQYTVWHDDKAELQSAGISIGTGMNNFNSNTSKSTEIIREKIPIYRDRIKEVIKEIPVDREIIKEVIKEVPVDRDNECVICFDGIKDTLITPCNHLVTCFDCCNKLEQCPICRGPIDNRIKVFMN